MKRLSLTAFLCLSVILLVSAAPRYWVGPVNGNWSDPANWSNTLNGSGGASVPATQDSVFFSPGTSSLIFIDQSPSIASLQVAGNVTMYASANVTFTIVKSLNVLEKQVLKDSTNSDVSFNTIISGANSAKATIIGDWVFEGATTIANPDNSGARFTAENGSLVMVSSALKSTSTTPYFGIQGGRIITKSNSGDISSNTSTLTFQYNSQFVSDNRSIALVPLATWANNFFSGGSGLSSNLTGPAASIIVNDNFRVFQFHEQVPSWSNLIIDAPGLSNDIDLSLPDGTLIKGDLKILNTNNHTVTILAQNGPSSTVTVNIGGVLSRPIGSLIIGGSTTKVALSRASASSASTNYNLFVNTDFTQTGGNFSLQDYNDVSGVSTLRVNENFNQTAGTFYTNSISTSPAAKFVLHMADPQFVSGPSGAFFPQRSLLVSSGTIDIPTHKVMLRVEHSIRAISGSINAPQGVLLLNPLQVGKLELVKGPLSASAINVLTVNDPSLDAVLIGGDRNTSYVDGPMRRATNVAQPYFFPVGKGNHYSAVSIWAYYNGSFIADSCYVIPTSSVPSIYEAEYFTNAYLSFAVDPSLRGVSQSEYWNFTKVSGSDARVKFKLRNPVVAAGESNTLVAARFETGKWVSAQESTLNPCAIPDSFVISKPLSDLGAFTFAYLDDKSVPATPSGLAPGLAYKVYTGNFTVLPDFNALSPVSSGVSNNVNIAVRPPGTDYNYAIKWDGYITISTPGDYTFQTISDDGSKIYFNAPYCQNQAAVVMNDSVHAATSVPGIRTINILTAGTYPITITYFQGYSGQSMEVYWTGPGISRQLIPDAVFKNGGTTTTPPSTGTGLNYKYYEGSFDALPNFAALTPVKTGTTPNVDISVRTAGVNDNFAFTWDGTITIPTTGTYTFETVSDDGSRLSLNGNVLVNNDGLHAATSATGNVTIATGTYPISISYFEKNGGESMQVYWSGPGISRQLIPDAAFGSGTVTPPTTGKGLNYKYYEGDFNALPDFNAITPLKTGTSANADITVRTPGVNDHFAIVWTGMINLPTAGTYTFETVSDDGSSIVFNGNTLVNNDGLHAPTSATGTVTVAAAGAYPITISYFEKDGGETMQLYWSGPGIARQLIPDAAFGSGTTPPAGNTSGLNYKYYEGDFNVLPDYSTLTPVKTGTSANVDISIRTSGVNDHFAFIWSGYINLPAAGTYTFETISDDGSKVYVNIPYSANVTGTVNNDGLHAPNSVSGTVTVSSAGRYPITVTFFEKDGGETMQLYWSGPGISRQLVPDAAFTTTDNADGVVTMSTASSTAVSSMINGSTTKIYPNPFVESFTVDYYNAGNIKSKVNIGLYDLGGKLMYSYQPSTLTTGNNRWLINMGSTNLLPGIYMAQIKVNGVPVKSIKLIKTKR